MRVVRLNHRERWFSLPVPFSTKKYPWIINEITSRSDSQCGRLSWSGGIWLDSNRGGDQVVRAVPGRVRRVRRATALHPVPVPLHPERRPVPFDVPGRPLRNGRLRLRRVPPDVRRVPWTRRRPVRRLRLRHHPAPRSLPRPLPIRLVAWPAPKSGQHLKIFHFYLGSVENWLFALWTELNLGRNLTDFRQELEPMRWNWKVCAE